MTVSTHAYSAVLVGTPDLPLSVRGGQISFDDGTAPHVRGELDIAEPSATVLAALDPRQANRVKLTATTDLGGAYSRVFDLSLRDRPRRLRGGVVSLALASDEAVADDYAPLAVDDGAFAVQSSLRAVVNYVLGKIGASLAPGPDASAQTYADADNLITDPSNQGAGTIFTGVGCQLEKNETAWAAHGTKSINLYNPSTAASWMHIGGDAGAMRLGMQAGREYVFSATGRVKGALSGTVDANARRLVAFWRNAAGTYESAVSPQLPTAVGSVQRLSVRFTIPAGATEAFVRCYLGYSAASSQIQWDAFRLSPYTGDPTDTDYWDGGTTATTGYAYSWNGAANNSTSRRIALINRPPDSLRWRAGVSALDFILPIVQAAALRLVCNEQRVWTLRDESYAATGVLDVRHGVNLIDGTDTLRREGLWFDAAVVHYTWTDRTGTQREAWDTYGLPGYTRVETIERPGVPYPGPGLAEYAVRRAQGRGREVAATVVADWRTNSEQPTVIILDGAPIQTGRTSIVTFDLDRDEMTVTTRTTDTPAGAIDLATGTIDSAIGTIDSDT